MLKITQFLIALSSCLALLSAPEKTHSTKNHSDISSQIADLEATLGEQDCGCDQNFLNTYEKVLIEYEILIKNNKNSEPPQNFTSTQSSALDYLTRCYSKINKSRSENLLDKQIKTLKETIAAGKIGPSFNEAYKQLIKVYKKKKSNLTDFDPAHEYYRNLITSTEAHFKEIRYASFQNTPAMDDFLSLARSKNLTPKDINYFNNLLDNLFVENKHSYRYDQFYKKYAIDVLLTVMANHQLEQDQINDIRNLAIIAREIMGSDKITDLLWWTELRSIEDKNEMMQFINQQMLSSNHELALKVLVELGKTDDIIAWSEILEYEVSKELFKKSIDAASK